MANGMEQTVVQEYVAMKVTQLSGELGKISSRDRLYGLLQQRIQRLTNALPVLSGGDEPPKRVRDAQKVVGQCVEDDLATYLNSDLQDEETQKKWLEQCGLGLRALDFVQYESASLRNSRRTFLSEITSSNSL